jgi:hypothetical protein
MQSDLADLFYHSEPFDVACDIANHPLNLEKYLDRYLHLRDEKHARAAGTESARSLAKKRVARAAAQEG